MFMDYEQMWGKLRNCLDEWSVCLDEEEAYWVNAILKQMDNLEYNSRKDLEASDEL